MNSLHLSLGQLRTLADRCGVRLERESPLGALLDAVPVPLDPLPTGDTLSKYRHALEAIAQPRGRVRIVTPGAAATKNAAFYVGTAGELVGCWPEAQGIHLSFPWNAEQLARAAGDVLLSELPWPGDPCSVSLSPAGLVTLAAAIDALKARRLGELLNRTQSKNGTSLRAEELRRQCELGRTASDGRWMVTLLHMVAPTAARGGDNPVATGLDELTQQGFLRRSGDAWQPTDLLERLAVAWSVPLPAITHEVVVMPAGQPLDYRCALAIRGEGPLWLLDFQGTLTDKPRIALRSLAGRDYVAWLREKHLSIQLPPPTPAAQTAESPTQKASAKTCQYCSAPLVGAAKFCASCGQPTQPEPAAPLVAVEVVSPQPSPPVTFPPRLPERARTAASAPAEKSTTPPPAVSKPPEKSATPSPAVSKPKAASTPATPSSPPQPTTPPASTPAPADAQQLCPNPKCAQPIAPGKIFCPSCGTAASSSPPAARRCVNPACQKLVPADKRFCTHCGTPCAK